MKNLSKLFVIFILILISQPAISQNKPIQNNDSTKNIKLTIRDMDDITTVFRDRRKFIRLAAINDSILNKDSLIMANYRTIIKNDSISIVNYKNNEIDKDSIISNQKSTIKSEQIKTDFWKKTTYISSGVSLVLLIINLLK